MSLKVHPLIITALSILLVSFANAYWMDFHLVKKQLAVIFFMTKKLTKPLWLFGRGKRRYYQSNI